MRTTRLTFILLVATSLLLTFGCSKKDGDAAKGAGGEATKGGQAKGSEAKKADDALPLVKKTWTIDGITIEGQIPKDWRETKMGSSGFIYKPKESFSAPMLWVAVDCSGSCSKIPENIKAAAAEQKKMHAAHYDTVEIVKDEAVKGGQAFRMKMMKQDKELGMAVRFYYEEGWPKAVKCLFQSNAPKDTHLVEQMAKLCDGFTIEMAE